MIRNELDVLLDKVQDVALRADLRSQIDRLKQKRSFGLVFEQHIPERVRLPQHPIRVGSQVVTRDADDSPTYEVTFLENGVATIEVIRDSDGAYLTAQEHGGGDEHAPVDALVVISDFGEPVLPGFRYLGAVERGGERPYHVVINGENHHALQALRFTHAGRVDCIYIDPPYNSGARDWKYNNDYVDDSDAYRHSKWLAFMERRLKLAKELLNPDDSVLIVTIDEKEYLRLGLLLEQTFAGARVQMVSTTISPRSTSRANEFSRVDEFAFFVFIGSSGPTAAAADSAVEEVRWFYLRRTHRHLVRGSRPNQFYPIYVDTATSRIVEIGEPMGLADRIEDAPTVDGAVAVYPVNPAGEQLIWGLTGPSLRQALRDGYVRVTPGTEHQPYTISYLSLPNIKRVERGELDVTGIRHDGSKVVVLPRGRAARPTTVWRESRHDAGAYGTSLLRSLVPGRRFPFPKSLYLVEDTLRLFVKDKPNAVVLDFFAGSGTTAHAVARLNRQDGGRRQSIMVTNNEVSADEASELRSRGLRPGDPEWEALGIFEHVARPRVEAAITGRTPDGDPIAGDYKFTDEFPMSEGFDENAAFLELRYLDADDVDLGLAYDDIAPLLWLRAGARGPIAPRLDPAGSPLPYAWTDQYGVLFDEDRWRAFVADRPDSATAAFIVTYSPTVFAGVAAELPPRMDTVRLYDTYLSLFQPGRGRA
ncbi:MAG: site-specific DNA-methyltransferase [Candidatus Limnocylindrales bacterium]